MVSGEKDPLVKIEIASKVIETIKKLNGCAEEGKPWLMEGAVLYSSEKHVPLVTFIHPGAHVLPQGANEMIVKFFKLHELPE